MKYPADKPFSQALLALVALAAVAISGPVSAQAIIGADTMTVTANVLGVCTVSANNLNFGAYQQNSVTNVQAQTTVDVNCPVSVAAYELGISVGPTPGTTTTRAMTGGVVADTLDYDLYTDGGRTNVWTDIFGSAGTVNSAGTGAVQTFDVFGEIPSGQNSNPGNYTDVVNVLVLF